KKLSETILALAKAPLMERYSGPVMFEGEGAVGMIRFTLAPHLGGTPVPEGLSPQEVKTFGGALTDKIGLKPLSPLLSIVDDPTAKVGAGKALIGGYKIDDEGVPAQRVEVVDVVDALDVPAVGLVAGTDVLTERDLGVTLDRDLVVVPQQDEVAQLLGAGQAARLGADALLQVAVGGDAPDGVVEYRLTRRGVRVEQPALAARRHRHPDGVADALAERDRALGYEKYTGRADAAKQYRAIAGEAIRAVATAAFHRGKPGLWIHPGKAHAGTVHVVDIGIPPGAPVAPDAGLLTAAVHALVPGREPAATKFSSGHVVAAGGSRGMTGALCLAADAAMRAGAGYVTALVPASLEPIFEARLLEVMTRAMADEAGALIADAVDDALAATARAGALVLGPGAGRRDGAFAFLREVAARADVPLLLDADGLNAHAGALDSLAVRKAPTVLTPHAGELARLLGTSSDEVGRRRLRSAREAARRAQAIVVLKGDDTIIARADGTVAINDLSAPGLATAGTGDVLSGIIGAHLAKGMDPFAAACAGVRRHAAAGRVAAEEHGAGGVIARDVIDALPRARRGEPAAPDE
ncbi:MAG: NAD(P)H-hydrate dehydratase, partial [Actinobacteria bacterium]|nr:NAD(P)H-hydrate dehydratase [Actinomycetota bacterium]